MSVGVERTEVLGLVRGAGETTQREPPRMDGG